MTKKLLMGNEAFAHAALEAGVRVVAGYPGTPSSELIETIAAEHAAGRAQGVHVEWSTNEKAALELLAGAAYCGARVLFTCKQVGLNVASDALMSLNYVGVKGGTVLFVADDPGPISSQTEQDTRRFAAFAKVPVLDPATPEQGFAMMQAAFDLSERYHTPVIVRPTTRIDHASTFFDVADETEARPVPEEGFERDPRWVIFPKRAFEAHGEIHERLRAMAHDFSADPTFAQFNPQFEGGVLTAKGQPADKVPAAAAAPIPAQAPTPVQDSAGLPRPRLGIVTGGVSAAYAREALRMVEERAEAEGFVVPPYRFMQVGTPYPFPEEAVERFVEGLDQVLVLEELDHVLEDALLAFAGKTHAPFDVRGKLTSDARDRGENDVDDCFARISWFLGLSCAGAPHAAYEATENAPLPVRPPVLCAGCPHRGSFYAVKRALAGRPAVLCGDIGCYTLGNAKPLDAVDTCLCMGAGITMAQGFAVAEPQKKHVAFVGDSTFFASGLTGLVNAVYNDHDITLIVLDNATTAMTGSQPHPGTGVTLDGAEAASRCSIPARAGARWLRLVMHANPLDIEAVGGRRARGHRLRRAFSAVLFEVPVHPAVKPSAIPRASGRRAAARAARSASPRAAAPASASTWTRAARRAVRVARRSSTPACATGAACACRCARSGQSPPRRNPGCGDGRPTTRPRCCACARTRGRARTRGCSAATIAPRTAPAAPDGSRSGRRLAMRSTCCWRAWAARARCWRRRCWRRRRRTKGGRCARPRPSAWRSAAAT